MHQIRLDAAWQLHRDPSPAAPHARPPSTCRLPLVGAGVTPPFRLERSFHKPTGLGDASRLALCFADLPAGTKIELNRHALAEPTMGGATHCWFAPRDLLDFNTVCLHIPAQASATGPQVIGPAWLEIEDNIP